VIGSIPDYSVFMTVDEMEASTERLVADFPRLVRVQTVGESRRGDAIRLVSVGDGSRNALACAGAHANEAIGCMTVEFLSRHLCENEALRGELGYTWHFVKCIDPDSVRLNEGWFKGPFSPTHYHANFYRQPQDEQPENLFPVNYKTLAFDQPLPETMALKAAMDAAEPEFVLSLHSAELGGIFYHVSRPCKPLYPLFHEIPEAFDLPFNLGETSLAFKTYAKAIHKTLGVKDFYEALKARGVDDPAQEITRGGSANEYVEEAYGAFCLVPEVPYWADWRFGDLSPADVSRREEIERALAQRESFIAWIRSHFDALEGALTLDTAFHRVVAEMLPKEDAPSRASLLVSDPDDDRPATMAEHVSAVYFREHMRQRARGMFVRMLDAEIVAGNNQETIIEARDTVFRQLREVGVRLEGTLDYQMIPIRTAISVQAWAGLATAKWLSA
jgi:hypothetical protein